MPYAWAVQGSWLCWSRWSCWLGAASPVRATIIAYSMPWMHSVCCQALLGTILFFVFFGSCKLVCQYSVELLGKYSLVVWVTNRLIQKEGRRCVYTVGLLGRYGPWRQAFVVMQVPMGRARWGLRRH